MKTFNLEEYIRDVKDFPKEGVIFKDITPLLNHPQASEQCLQELRDLIGDLKIDKVVGIESRGFFLWNIIS